MYRGMWLVGVELSSVREPLGRDHMESRNKLAGRVDVFERLTERRERIKTQRRSDIDKLYDVEPPLAELVARYELLRLTKPPSDLALRQISLLSSLDQRKDQSAIARIGNALGHMDSLFR